MDEFTNDLEPVLNVHTGRVGWLDHTAYGVWVGVLWADGSYGPALASDLRFTHGYKEQT